MFFDNFFLGADNRCIVSTNSNETQLNNNVIVVGGSGSGKTFSVLLPTLLHLQHSNAVGIFTKRNALDLAANVLKKRGYNVHIIDFVQPSKSSYGYDPLTFCSSDSDVSDLAHCIINSAPANGYEYRLDPFWNDSAENLLNIVLKYVHHGHFANGNSFSNALELLDTLYICPKSNSFLDDDKLLDPDAPCEPDYKTFEPPLIFKEFDNDKLKAIDQSSFAFWQSFKHLAADVTSSCIVSSLHTPLQKTFSADIRNIINKKNNFDFRYLLNPHTALFLYISPVSSAHHRFVSIFYQQLFNSLFQIAESYTNSVLPYPVHIFCDDFATGCRVPNFPTLISILREKAISVMLLLQSESQLVSMYGQTDAANIISNCDSYVFLGSMDWENCHNIARRLNLPTNNVANMPVGSEIFIRRGQKPFCTSRYNLNSDPIFLNSNSKTPVKPNTTSKQKANYKIISLFANH